MSLVIERLQQRIRSPAPLPAERIQAFADAWTSVDGDRIAAELARDDEWLLIRRLSLRLSAPLESSDFALTSLWQRALHEALQQAAEQGDAANVLRYASRRDALADMLYRSAQGDVSRQWAWQRMGLLPRAEASAVDALGQALRQLIDAPHAIWPVLHRLLLGEAATAGLSAVLHALPEPAWQQLLTASPHTRGYLLQLPSGPPATLVLPATQALASAAVAPDSWQGMPAQLAGAAQDIDQQPEAVALLAWGSSRAPLVARRLGPLAVLLAGLVRSSAGQPGQASRALVVQTLRRLTSPVSAPRLAPADLAGPAAALGSSAQVATAPASQPTAQSPTPPQRPSNLPSLPDLPDAVEWQATAWAGSLFWLARLDADALQEIAEPGGEPAREQPLPTRLQAIGLTLGVQADDPALRAFCGGKLPAEPPSPSLLTQAARLVAEWGRWLDEAAPDLPAPRLAGICRRPGRLRFEAGWIELHLPLDSVQTPIRRLGLDLDPGWLPWLGCVLRICYDAA